MSASSDGPRDPAMPAIISTTLDDLLVPGVVVELDAREAEDLGAFEEIALTEAEAWEANSDLDTDEVRDGE
jgi:type IV secretion system protein VirB1